jgi:hypothetical protein
VPPSSTARTERPSKATKTPPVPTPPRLALAVAASDQLLPSSLLLLLCYSIYIYIYSSRCPRRRRRRLDASEEEEKQRPDGYPFACDRGRGGRRYIDDGPRRRCPRLLPRPPHRPRRRVLRLPPLLRRRSPPPGTYVRLARKTTLCAVLQSPDEIDDLSTYRVFGVLSSRPVGSFLS